MNEQGKGRHRDDLFTGRFMEPFVLLALATGPAYGYELAQTLGGLGFRRAAKDPSLIYKLLRTLEGHGDLTSTWSIGEAGPPRRMYQLTTQGEQHLHQRATALTRQAEHIDLFLTRYHDRFATIGKGQRDTDGDATNQ